MANLMDKTLGHALSLTRRSTAECKRGRADCCGSWRVAGSLWPQDRAACPSHQCACCSNGLPTFILALLFAVGLDGIEPVIEVPPAAKRPCAS
jgi:hypothetical protein